MVRVSRRLIWWVGGGLAGLVLLLVLAVAIAVLVIDPNRYKPRIVSMVREATGRELTLSGDLSWSVFPWLVVRAGAGQLGNPAGDASGEPFARWQSLRLGVKVMPLIRERQLILDRVEANGLELHLRRDADGRSNWDFASAQPASASGGATPVQVDAVALRDATVSFDDEPAAAHWRATRMKLDARIPEGVTTDALAVENFAFEAHVQGGPLPAAGVDVALQTPRAAFSAVSKDFSAAQWQARFAGAQLSGKVAGNAGTAMRAAGDLEASMPSVRDVLLAAGVQAPATRDRAVFGKLDLQGSFEFAGDTLRITPVTLRLDDTALSGSLDVPSIARRELAFDLRGDRLIVDRYLEPEDAVSEPFELPVAQLKALQANGTLTLEHAEMAGAALDGVRLRVITGAEGA